MNGIVTKILFRCFVFLDNYAVRGRSDCRIAVLAESPLNSSYDIMGIIRCHACSVRTDETQEAGEAQRQSGQISQGEVTRHIDCEHSIANKRPNCVIS